MNKIIFVAVFGFLAIFQSACSQPTTQPTSNGQTESTTVKSTTETDGNKTAENQTAPTNNVASPAENAKKQAERVADLFIIGDYDRFFDLTHPKLVEKMGGKEKVMAQTKASLTKLKKEGYEFVSMQIESPTQVTTVGNETFAVLPTALTMKVPQGQSVQPGFLLGVSEDNGQNWKFVSGTTKEQLKTLFPEAVEKLEIPDPKTPIITTK